MFINDIVGVQVPASLTETHPALPKHVTLRLRSENGATDRANSLYGSLKIAHSTTKEVGGGYRHVSRVDLRAQGDIPAAAAYDVIINNDSVLGEARAAQAWLAKLVALCQLDGVNSVSDTDVNSNGFVTQFRDAEGVGVTWEAALEHAFLAIIPRLLGRES